MLFNLNMGVWRFPVGLKFNWRVLWDSERYQYYWKVLKSQIAVFSGPEGATDLFTVLKGPDQQGGSECPWVVEG